MKYELGKDFIFDKEKHEYRFLSDDTVCYSCTELIEKAGIGTPFKELLKIDRLKEPIIMTSEKGTLIHSMLEEYFKTGDEFILYENEEAEFAVKALESLLKKDGFTLKDVKILSETSLVEREPICYGGTIDLLIKEPNGKSMIIDFKTGTAQKEKEEWQLSLYRNLWKANTGEEIDNLYTINTKKNVLTVLNKKTDKEINTLLTCVVEDKKMIKETVNANEAFLAKEKELVAIQERLKKAEAVNVIIAYNELQDNLKKCKDELKGLWDFDLGTVETDNNKITYSESTTLDSTLLKKKYPEVYNDCLKTSTTFRITPKKVNEEVKENDKATTVNKEKR